MNEENKRLTDDQKKQIPFYLEKWQNIALSTQEIDREEVTETLNHFYQFSNLKQPALLFFDSPWGAIEYLLEDNKIQLGTAINNLLALTKFKFQVVHEDYDTDNKNNFLNKVNFNLELKQLLSAPIAAIINSSLETVSIRELGHRFLDLEVEETEIENRLEHEYYTKIVNALLKNNFTKETCKQLITNPQSIKKIHPEVLEIWQQIIERHNITRPDPSPDNNKLKLREIQSLIHCGIPEYRRNIFCQKLAGDCAVIDFKISVLNYPFDLEKWKILETLVTNLSWIFPFNEICLVCARPSKILLDSEKRLHAEGENAIEFADGWLKKYYYRGDPIPEEYGQIHPSKWKSEWILSEKNAHLRGVLIREIGYLRICQELRSELIDTWKEYELIKIEENIEPNSFNLEPILLLKMICPSTKKIHVLRVPPNMTSARKAIKWINWGIDPDDFSIQT
ncbi:MAG: DUF6745 domain-containing protein [Prochloraceae cyanobacterium]